MTTATENGKDTMPPGAGHEGQTFLVGDDIYLRTIEPGDEKSATSWRQSIFPKAESLVKKWIEEDLPKEGGNQRGHLLMVRKSDDVVVGSLIQRQLNMGSRMTVRCDALYGDVGARWEAEAVRLATEWQVHESHTPMIVTAVGGDRTVLIDALKAQGFVETARLRQMQIANGERVDRVHLQYFHPDWLATLGDPMAAEIERTGKGEVSPVPAPVTAEGDPPKNAVLIGKRIYLRPAQKEDTADAVEWAHRETDVHIDNGRHLMTEVKMVNWMIEGQKEDFPGWVELAVCLRENDELIGSVSFEADWTSGTAETGSWFHRTDYREQGYGTEAKQLLLQYLFDVLGFHAIESWVNMTNPRSAAALRKQGYRDAGRICWMLPYHGNFTGMQVFDLLAEEWRALPRE